jgi:hypothetical protein
MWYAEIAKRPGTVPKYYKRLSEEGTVRCRVELVFARALLNQVSTT